MRVSHPRRFYVPLPQCLKISQKVAFNIAIDAAKQYYQTGQFK